MKFKKTQKWMVIALSFALCFAFSGTIVNPIIANADTIVHTDAIARAATIGQSSIPAVEAWPNIPSPFSIRDWTKTANDFYNLAFDEQAEGRDLPIIKTFIINHPSLGGFTGETFVCPVT